MRKFITVFILLNMIFSFSFAEVDIDANEITLIVDGVKMNAFDEEQQIYLPPFTFNSRTMLPLKKTFELFGINSDQIFWNGSDQSVTVLTNEGNTIWLQINNKNLKFNNTIIETDVPAIIYENRTFVPVAILSRLLGETPIWNGETETVTMNPSTVRLEDEKLQYVLSRKDGFILPYYDEDFESYLIKRWSTESKSYDALIKMRVTEGSFSNAIQETAEQYFIRSDEFVVLNDTDMIVYYNHNGKYIAIVHLEQNNYILEISGLSFQTLINFLTSMEVIA
ncbi:MAG: copper amine oxidase N-terminal domain-containing protein [Clostridia bacterium]|nr:copper amine oxidase N-terminal domain-containing protein [Clostridia bacterium]